MGPCKVFWSPKDINLIQMVKEHPIIYNKDLTLTEDQYQATLNIAWKEISGNLDIPIKRCKRQWTEIKSNYAVLKNYINTGKVSKELANRNDQTRYLLDGTLSFMDPFLCEITIDHISSSVHEHFDKIFEKAQQVHGDNNTIIQHEQTTHAENENAKDTEVTYEKDNLGLESEVIIEDVKVEIQIEDDVMEDNLIQDVDENDSLDVIVPDNPKPIVVNEINNTLGSNVNLVVSESKQTIPTVINSNLASTIAVSDNIMRKFFNELGDDLSRELSLEKQKILQSQINALLKEEFDEEENILNLYQ